MGKTFKATYSICFHDRGFFKKIRTFFIKREKFICVECNSILDGKYIRAIWDARGIKPKDLTS